MRIALATCTLFPELHEDDRLLHAALSARGHDVSVPVWNDPAVDWSSFDRVAIRNTWDYYLQRDAFLRWVQMTSRATTVLNPPAVIAWNTHKGYLRDLEARGVSLVPTEWIPRGQQQVELGAVLASRGWQEAVVKPAVSAGAHETRRVDAATLPEASALLTRILGRCDAMIQPYLRSVEEDGERSLLFAGAAYSHGIRKHALLAPAGVSPEDQAEGVPRLEPSPEEIAFAVRVLDAARQATGESFAYARVDIAPTAHGIALMELEVTEPSLFLRSDPAAADRFAGALLAAGAASARRA